MLKNTIIAEIMSILYDQVSLHCECNETCFSSGLRWVFHWCEYVLEWLHL